MRSRAARLVLSTLAWAALGGAAFFTFQIQERIDHRRTALRAFEAVARDAADALDDAQAGQQAYVAIGQDAREWMPKVAAFLQTASTSIDTLRTTAVNQASGPALLDASTALTQVRNADRSVREHLASDETRRAADTVFSEAADGFSKAISNVDAASSAERRDAASEEARLRSAQLYVLAGAGIFVGLALTLLSLSPQVSGADADSQDADSVEAEAGLAGLSHLAGETVAAGHTAPSTAPPATAPDAGQLTALADLSADFARVQDAEGLRALLERAAGLLNARGIIVWMGSSAGADLRPVLAFGYSDATLARIPRVTRGADNAAAAAYRTGDVQVVGSGASGAQGAVVAPLLTSDGCIGALTAEIRDRGEESAWTHATARVVAALLAGVLAAPAEDAGANDTKATAAAG